MADLEQGSDGEAALWDRVSVPVEATASIIRFESCVLHPYRDSGGVWTIGDGDIVGADGQRVTAATAPITAAQAAGLLARDIGKYGPAIAAAISTPLTLLQAAALYSFVHNFGTGALPGSAIARMLMAGQGALAADQLPGWCLVGGQVELGLLRRRWAERLMMLGTPSLPAYGTAWGMGLPQLLPGYHKAIADAAGWRLHPSLLVPQRPSTVPRTALIPSADDLNAAVLAGIPFLGAT